MTSPHLGGIQDLWSVGDTVTIHVPVTGDDRLPIDPTLVLDSECGMLLLADGTQIHGTTAAPTPPSATWVASIYTGGHAAGRYVFQLKLLFAEGWRTVRQTTIDLGRSAV